MIVGVETGGTKVVCAASAAERPDAPDAVETFPTTGPAETLERIRAFVTEASGPSGPDAIGIASFGPLDMDRESRGYGRILATPKIGWEGTDVIGPLAEVFDAPIVLMTDVTGALKAEALWGAARHFDDVVYLTIGTGIGAGILSGGRVLAGTGYPEIGHLPVRRHPSDRFDGVCRFHGDCVEGLASGPAIGARWGAGLPDLGGDELRQAMELEEFYTGQIISALHYTLGTRRFIVGGGVANWTGLRSGIASAAAELVGGGTDPHKDGDLLSVVAPELGGLAGVTGALAAAGELVNRDR